ncbi:XkdX family protein [Paenibacillus sp. T2-29]
MTFWSLAFKWRWVTAEQLKGAVITDMNRFGEITPAEYKTITGIEFT